MRNPGVPLADNNSSHGRTGLGKMDRRITPSNTELGLQTIAPGKLAKSYWPGTSRTSVASCPLGHYKLMELRPKHFHNFYTELQKIISVLEEKSLKCETYFKLIIATGMRRGKSCDLQWGNINWQERFIHIQRNVVKVTGEEIIVKDAKLLAGDWYVYFSLETGSLLQEFSGNVPGRRRCSMGAEDPRNQTRFPQRPRSTVHLSSVQTAAS